MAYTYELQHNRGGEGLDVVATFDDGIVVRVVWYGEVKETKDALKTRIMGLYNAAAGEKDSLAAIKADLDTVLTGV